MFCKFCGNEIKDDAVFCDKCGSRVNGDGAIPPLGQAQQQERVGLSIASLVLGILGVGAWIIPLVGFPVTIVGLVLGIIGYKKGKKGLAIAGIILSIVMLVATIVNSAIGAYQGYKGVAWFQKQSQEQSVDDKMDASTEAEDTVAVHTLKFVTNYGTDQEEVVLTEKNVKSASVSIQELATGEKDYVVSLVFDEEGTEKFAKATEENIGKQISILVDDEVMSSPTVVAAITGGEAQINGLGGYDEASELAASLNQAK